MVNFWEIFLKNFKNWDINAGFELFVFVFFLKKIVVLFPIIYKSNKCFIISISYSSNVLKISPKKKKKTNKQTYPTSYNKINVNKFGNVEGDETLKVMKR